jgi:hypothetical protein
MAGGDYVNANSKERGGAIFPFWKLFLIALPQLGVQVLWCFLGPNSAPYMKHLGMGSALATLNNVAGPITGFFTAPIVGATSDVCTSKYGRRRPVIAFGLASFMVAGCLFTGAEHVIGDKALWVAAPMFWVVDVTVNILQTPHRALAADFASEEQQVATQVLFVFIGAVGNFMGYSAMQIYEVPVDHMFELMLGICVLNVVLVAIQFVVAQEKPLERDPNAPKVSVCDPVTNVWKAAKGSPRLLYHLAFIQTLIWIGLTAWNGYGGQWFANSVFQGDETAPEGSVEKEHYAEGIAAFSFAGQMKAVAQLLSTLLIMYLMMNTSIRPRYLYAPCIFIGFVSSLLAALVVGHDGNFAEVCMIMAVFPETGCFSIPFGLIATMNKRLEKQGKPVSTALQMALLNCCITVGQQICTLTLAGIEGKLSLEKALPCVFMLAAIAQGVAGGSTLFLDDKSVEDEPDKTTTGETTTSEEENNTSDESE